MSVTEGDFTQGYRTGAYARSPVAGPAIVDGDLHHCHVLIVLEDVARILSSRARVGNHEEGLELGDGTCHISICLHQQERYLTHENASKSNCTSSYASICCGCFLATPIQGAAQIHRIAEETCFLMSFQSAGP